MSTSHDQAWDTASSPRALLRLSKLRPSGRKYLLLACATVRHLMPGRRSELGRSILDILEGFAVAQPARGVTTDLWRDVIRKRFPGLGEPLPWPWEEAGDDERWLRSFTVRLRALSAVRAADVNVVLDIAFARERLEVRTAAENETQELAKRLTSESSPAPQGFFGRLLRIAPRRTLPIERFREEIIARLATPAKQEIVRRSWRGPQAPEIAQYWGRMYLASDRIESRLTVANRRAADLVREVFGNPFRPVVIRPEWREANFGAALRIAEHVVNTGSYAEVPILADALEEAGCDDEVMLRHCRTGTHVPGCWVLDAVLGRN